MPIVSSVCRIVDPNVTCLQSDFDYGFLDIDFSVTLVHTNLTHDFPILGLSEPVKDVLSFPVVRNESKKMIQIRGLGQASKQ